MSESVYQIKQLNPFVTFLEVTSLEEATDVCYSKEEIQLELGIEELDGFRVGPEYYQSIENMGRGKPSCHVLLNHALLRAELDNRFADKKTKRVTWVELGFYPFGLDFGDNFIPVTVWGSPVCSVGLVSSLTSLDGDTYRNSSRSCAFIRVGSTTKKKPKAQLVVTKQIQHKLATTLCYQSLVWFREKQPWVIARMGCTKKQTQLTLLRFMLDQGCPRTLLQDSRTSLKNDTGGGGWEYGHDLVQIPDDVFEANVVALYEWIDNIEELVVNQ